MRFHSLAPYGARRHLLPSFRQYGCFNSLAPYGARHILRDIGKPDGTVSIHQLLTELDPHSPTVALTALKFQFTSSLRSQTISSAITQSSLHVSIHQLLTELDKWHINWITRIGMFQFTSSLRSQTILLPLFLQISNCFNSLAPYGARRQTFTIIFSYITTFLSSFAKFQ